MLDVAQVEEYYSSQVKYFFKRSKYASLNMASMRHPYLIKDEADRLLAVAENPMSVNALADITCIPTYSFFIDPTTNYNNVIELNKAWQWKVDLDTKSWVVDLNFKSIEHLAKCILVNQKIVLLDLIHDTIETYRRDFTDQLAGMDSVYMLKYLEAKEILEQNIKTDTLLKYPMVSGYADTVNISLKESARLIMLQHEDATAFLAESENLRIRFTNIIRKETNLQKLAGILEDFNTENVNYSFL